MDAPSNGSAKPASIARLARELDGEAFPIRASEACTHAPDPIPSQAGLRLCCVGDRMVRPRLRSWTESRSSTLCAAPVRELRSPVPGTVDSRSHPHVGSASLRDRIWPPPSCARWRWPRPSAARHAQGRAPRIAVQNLPRTVTEQPLPWRQAQLHRLHQTLHFELPGDLAWRTSFFKGLSERLQACTGRKRVRSSRANHGGLGLAHFRVTADRPAVEVGLSVLSAYRKKARPSWPWSKTSAQ